MTARRLMGRMLPDTILGRTALVLVAAVVLVLGWTVYRFDDQRSHALAALGGRNAAERVAALALLLDSISPDNRRAALNSMDTPGFRAGWSMMPVVGPGDMPSGFAAEVAGYIQDRVKDREVRVSDSLPPPPAFGPPSERGRDDMDHDGAKDREGRDRDGWERKRDRHSMGLPPGALLIYGPVLRISVQLADQSWLNVAAPMDRGEPLWQVRFMVPLLSALVLVMAAALWAVRWAARPFAGFTKAAERLGVDVAAPPMAEDGPREVRQAAHAFNVMQGRIRRFVQDRTQMLAAISHDLRTPITRMRLRAEFVEDEVERAKMLADLDEMERMIAATLAFARDDAAREDRRPVDLAALVDGLADDFGAHYDGPDQLVMDARPMALKRAMANLLDNARKYGNGTVIARLQDQGGQVVILVLDDGPGIPADQFERVFAPFFRLEASRNRETGGTGLGLSVARAAARAHGGDIVLSNRPEGGLEVRMVLPRG